MDDILIFRINFLSKRVLNIINLGIHQYNKTSVQSINISKSIDLNSLDPFLLSQVLWFELLSLCIHFFLGLSSWGSNRSGGDP